MEKWGPWSPGWQGQSWRAPGWEGLGQGREGSQRVPVLRSSPSMSLWVGLGMAKHIFEGCASLPALTASILCSRIDKKQRNISFFGFFYLPFLGFFSFSWSAGFLQNINA